MLYKLSFLLSLILFIGCETTTFDREVEDFNNSQVLDQNPNQDVYVGGSSGEKQKQKDLEESKRLYYKCAGCHGANGDKKALGKSGLIGAMSEDEIIVALKSYRNGTRNLYGMGELMKGQTSTLSDSQIINIARYMSQRIDDLVIEGRRIYESSLSAVCQMKALDFVNQHTQSEWSAIYKNGKLDEEVYNICPTTKDIFKSSDEKYLYAFLYYYASK